MKDSSESSFSDANPTSSDPIRSTPKEYVKALERVTQALEEQQPSTTLEKVLFGIGLFLCFILLIPQLLDWFSYPYWLELFYDFSIFAEASLPLVVSFFLKNKQQATILQIAGTIVLLTYAMTYF
ncbi:MAG: hypothetical protein ACRBFS_03700 [Aureispira sp.]